MLFKRSVLNISNAFFSIIILIVSVVVIANASYSFAAGSNISLTSSSINVDAEATVTVYLTGDSVDAVSWESTNTDAVSIETSTSRKAVVKGVGQGVSDIVATDENGNTAICKVTVVLPKFAISGNDSLEVEEHRQIYVREGSAVNWLSSNNDIVSISDSSSSSATIKAESVGTATITAIDKFGSEANCTITVWQEKIDVSLYPVNGSGDEYTETATFDYYWQSNYQEGWWDGDDNYHDSYWYYEELRYYNIEANRGTIAKCSSANNNIVYVKLINGTYSIHPKGIGSTVVTVTNPYGESINIKCVVKLNYFIEKECIFAYQDECETVKKYSYKNLKYGSGKLEGETYDNAKVTAVIKGKSYSGKANSSGYYTISVPKYIKIGTSITIKATQYGVTKTVKRKVVNNKPSGTLTYKVNGKTIKVTIKEIHKGDYIKLKVGKKTYTKRIKKDQKKLKYSVKTKKLKKGTKVKITVYNKFKQTLKVKAFKIR